MIWFGQKLLIFENVRRYSTKMWNICEYLRVLYFGGGGCAFSCEQIPSRFFCLLVCFLENVSVKVI